MSVMFHIDAPIQRGKRRLETKQKWKQNKLHSLLQSTKTSNVLNTYVSLHAKVMTS